MQRCKHHEPTQINMNRAKRSIGQLWQPFYEKQSISAGHQSQVEDLDK